jgi:hypothetical protein
MCLNLMLLLFFPTLVAFAFKNWQKYSKQTHTGRSAKNVFLLLNLIFPVLAFGQNNYKAGYIVKSNGDTVKGYINYREWDRTPKKIEFKSQLQDQEVLGFTPAAVRSFTIDKLESYISYTGRVSMDNVTFPDLPDELDTTTAVDTIYLKVLATGENVSLLSNEDKIRPRFFFKEASNDPQELIYHQYYVDGQDTREIKTYTYQLIMLLHKYRPGNELDEQKVGRAAFNGFDLVKAINIINNDHTNHITQGSSNNRFFIGLGVNYSKIKFEGEGTFSNPASNKASLFPYISVGVDIFNNPNVQKFAFRVELSFFHAVGNLTSRPTSNGISYDYQDKYQISQYTATVAPQLFYNLYNANLFKFYLGIGAGLNFSVYPVNKITIDEAHYTLNKPYDFKHYYTSLPFQAGALINKKIELFFMYVRNGAFTDYVYYSITSDSFNAGIRYHFAKK